MKDRGEDAVDLFGAKPVGQVGAGKCTGLFLVDVMITSIELVAQQAGFGSALSLRQHFRAAFNTSPTAYRRQFRTV